MTPAELDLWLLTYTLEELLPDIFRAYGYDAAREVLQKRDGFLLGELPPTQADFERPSEEDSKWLVVVDRDGGKWYLGRTHGIRLCRGEVVAWRR
jgi:hypothetical protein